LTDSSLAVMALDYGLIGEKFLRKECLTYCGKTQLSVLIIVWHKSSKSDIVDVGHLLLDRR